MSDFILKEVSNIENELQQIGFDSSYLLQAENKLKIIQKCDSDIQIGCIDNPDMVYSEICMR